MTWRLKEPVRSHLELRTTHRVAGSLDHRGGAFLGHRIQVYGLGFTRQGSGFGVWV